MRSLINSKVSSYGGGGGGYVSRPTRTEKLYRAALAIYVYKDGTVEIGKNRNGPVGSADIDMAAEQFSRVLASMQLKETELGMFKEGLSQLLYEAIQNVLKGNHYERTVRSTSTGDGSHTNRSP